MSSSRIWRGLEDVDSGAGVDDANGVVDVVNVGRDAGRDGPHAQHTRTPLHPAALASVPYGILLVRVRVWTATTMCFMSNRNRGTDAEIRGV